MDNRTVNSRRNESHFRMKTAEQMFQNKTAKNTLAEKRGRSQLHCPNLFTQKGANQWTSWEGVRTVMVQTSGPSRRGSEQSWSKPVDQLGGGPNSHGPNQWTSMEVVRTVPEHGPNQCQEMVKKSTRQKWSKPVDQLGDGLNSIRTRSRRSEQYQNKVQTV